MQLAGEKLSVEGASLIKGRREGILRVGSKGPERERFDWRGPTQGGETIPIREGRGGLDKNEAPANVSGREDLSCFGKKRRPRGAGRPAGGGESEKLP